MIVRLLIAVFAAAGLLAGGRAWELSRTPLPLLLDPVAAAEAAAAAPGLRAPAIAPAGMEQIANLVERPPFSATRRPGEPVAEETAEPNAVAPDQRFEARLLGVVKDGTERLAVLVHGAGAETVIVRQGSEIGGWMVEIIGDSRVILRNGDSKVEIELFVDQ